MSTATQVQPYMRLQDRVSTPLDHGAWRTAQLVKNWKHTDPEPHNLFEVRIQHVGDALSMQCFGNGEVVPVSSSAVHINTLFAANSGSRDAMSFFADVDFGFMVSRFQGNVNLGLLVLAGFHDFKDGSARSNFFSREFFYSVSGLQAQLSAPMISGQPDDSRHRDTSSLLGRWRNTNSASQGVAIVEILDRGEHLGIRAYGVGQSGNLDWGEVPGHAYADCSSHEAMAFSSVVALEGIRCHFQANIKQGVLVVAYFTEFDDGSGRSNYFTREFYYKETDAD